MLNEGLGIVFYKLCVFREHLSVCMCVCASFPFSFEGGMCDLIVLIPDYCLSFGMRPQLFLLYSLIIHSSMNLFSQHSRQFILSFFQVFEA